jgi:hypothetical protein
MKAIHIKKKGGVALTPTIVEVEQSGKGFRKFFPKGIMTVSRVSIGGVPCRLYYLDKDDYEDDGHPMVFSSDGENFNVFSDLIIISDKIKDEKTIILKHWGNNKLVID